MPLDHQAYADTLQVGSPGYVVEHYVWAMGSSSPRYIVFKCYLTFNSSAVHEQVIKGFCAKSDGKDKLTALVQV